MTTSQLNQLQKDGNVQTFKKKYTTITGIDPGVETGFCVWNAKEKLIIILATYPIHAAMHQLGIHYEINPNTLVRVEDARKRTWFGETGKEKLKGAGSICRDCKIWEDYLTDLGIDFEMVHPKNIKTKLNSKTFKKYTGFKGQTNQHERDACMMVFGMG